MAATAEIQRNPSETTDADEFSLFQHFLAVDLNSDSDSAEPSSADQYRGWEELVHRKILGVDEQNQAIYRPSPRSSSEVRKEPSSTGKLVEWEGVVESVMSDKFDARLTAIKGSDVDFDEFTSFEVARVPQDDHDLIHPGALFRLVVGYQALGGTRQQYSRLTFRRLPAWNQNAIDEAQLKFKQIVNNIEWSDEVTSSG